MFTIGSAVCETLQRCAWRNTSTLACAQQLNACIPMLTGAQRKGECGRIGVVGGSGEYTGAPYYAAMTAMRLGADLVHVFCPPSAATVIKTYSPELIVHPILTQDTQAKLIEWLERMHAIVLGPGLGRDDPALPGLVKIVIDTAKRLNKPLTIDADGLWFVHLQPELIVGYTNCAITPNAVEFDRLCSACNVHERTAHALADRLRGVTVVRKAAVDNISNATIDIDCDECGSLRRCGGQGDLLSGALGVFSHWTSRCVRAVHTCELYVRNNTGLPVAAWGACALVRECARRCYHEHGRATTANDMLAHVEHAAHTLFTKY